MYKPAAAQLLFLQGVKNENFAQSQIRIQKKSLFEFQFYDHSAMYGDLSARLRILYVKRSDFLGYNLMLMLSLARLLLGRAFHPLANVAFSVLISRPESQLRRSKAARNFRISPLISPFN